jgi:hypothetical protein
MPGYRAPALGGVNDRTHGQQFRSRFMRTSAPTTPSMARVGARPPASVGRYFAGPRLMALCASAATNQLEGRNSDDESVAATCLGRNPGCAVVLGGPGSAAAQTRPAQGAPEGEMRFALYVTILPAWFDPGETGPGNLTSFWMLYALHDALVKPMPGNPMAPSLAEAWTESPDKRVYEFKLRAGLKFYNGEPVHRRRRQVQL